MLTPVVTEAAFLVGRRLGWVAEARFIGDLAAGDFEVEAVAASDWERIAELVIGHADLGLGTADASVVAAAERLGIASVATLDRRHLTVVRPRHVERFTLPLLD
ncbi:MAG: type II toxin-antitoxin system VapC family toxin [Thermoleophilia bacterium]